jgi:hypothetical protein
MYLCNISEYNPSYKNLTMKLPAFLYMKKSEVATCQYYFLENKVASIYYLQNADIDVQKKITCSQRLPSRDEAGSDTNKYYGYRVRVVVSLWNSESNTDCFGCVRY